MGCGKWGSELSFWNEYDFWIPNTGGQSLLKGYETVTSWREKGNIEKAPRALVGSRAGVTTCHKMTPVTLPHILKGGEQQGPDPTWRGVGNGKDTGWAPLQLTGRDYQWRGLSCPSWAIQGEQEVNSRVTVNRTSPGLAKELLKLTAGAEQKALGENLM